MKRAYTEATDHQISMLQQIYIPLPSSLPFSNTLFVTGIKRPRATIQQSTALPVEIWMNIVSRLNLCTGAAYR
jgi:hypothetical protein